MWLILSASPPTFALILAAPSCAVVPSNMFIFAPGKDESLQATPTKTIKQRAPTGARSFRIERVYSQGGRSETRERCVRPIFLAANGRDYLAPAGNGRGISMPKCANR